MKHSTPMARLRPLLITLAALIVFMIGSVWLLRTWYYASLKPVSSSSAMTNFTINPGNNVHQIGQNLQKAHLIRSAKAFETYVRSNELHDKLQAGTYQLSPSLSVSQIVHKMVAGQVAKNLLTILPAKRLGDIKQAFAKAGYNQREIDDAFNVNNYRDHPALANLPAGASLEGYLYPDSFQRDNSTPAKTIIGESLDEMKQHLNTDVTNGFTAQGLNIHQGVTLASIVAQETDNSQYQPTVAQVFYSRLHQGINLGSDVTAFYAAAQAHKPKSLNVDSAYNTYLHKGLPPGPISNVTKDALAAVAHPSNTDYLFFVAGDDGKVYFSHTAAEHDALAKQYCIKKCAL